MRHQCWLVFPIGVLMSISSAIGLFHRKDIYSNLTELMQAKGLGQNLFLLLVFLPLWGVIATQVRKGSMQIALIWAGLLGYCLYTYLLFSFDLRFNVLFLFHVALLGFSLYGFIGAVASIMPLKTDAALYEDARFIKMLFIFLFTLLIAVYGLWLGDVLKATFSGEIPHGARQWQTPTYGIHVMDMGIFLPGVFITIVKLWKKQTQGILLSGIILVFLSIQGLAIVIMEATAILSNQSVPLFRVVPDVSLTLICFAATVIFLRRIGKAVWHP